MAVLLPRWLTSNGREMDSHLKGNETHLYCFVQGAEVDNLAQAWSILRSG